MLLFKLSRLFYRRCRQSRSNCRFQRLLIIQTTAALQQIRSLRTDSSHDSSADQSRDALQKVTSLSAEVEELNERLRTKSRQVQVRPSVMRRMHFSQFTLYFSQIICSTNVWDHSGPWEHSGTVTQHFLWSPEILLRSEIFY